MPESRTGRDFGALSASPSQTIHTNSLKQEVNRRLAAHKSRIGSTVTEPQAPAEAQHGASSRATQAAARVAERYAKAPSYSEMLTGEARAAVRAAEAVSWAALDAQADAESVLTGLEAGSGVDPAREPKVSVDDVREQGWKLTAQPAAPSSSQPPEALLLDIRWEPDFPVRPAKPAATRTSRKNGRL